MFDIGTEEFPLFLKLVAGLWRLEYLCPDDVLVTGQRVSICRWPLGHPWLSECMSRWWLRSGAVAWPRSLEQPRPARPWPARARHSPHFTQKPDASLHPQHHAPSSHHSWKSCCHRRSYSRKVNEPDHLHRRTLVTLLVSRTAIYMIIHFGSRGLSCHDGPYDQILAKLRRRFTAKQVTVTVDVNADSEQ